MVGASSWKVAQVVAGEFVGQPGEFLGGFGFGEVGDGSQNSLLPLREKVSVEPTDEGCRPRSFR